MRWSPSEAGQRWRTMGLPARAGVLLVIAVLYFAAAKFGFQLAFATKQVTAVWPPTALAAVAYLFFGSRVWPGVFLGALWINAISDEPFWTAAGIAIGNTAAGLVGIGLMRRLTGFDPRLEGVRSVLAWTVFAAAAGCAVSASNGVLQLALGGIIPWGAVPSVWWVWWIGDTMGVLLLGPLLLTLIWRPSLPLTTRQLIEVALLFVALAGLCVLVFAQQHAETESSFRLEYAVFPIVIWIALRCTQREVAIAIVLICGCAVWGATHDRGPFAWGTLDHRLILLELFMAVTSLTGLILGAVTAERKVAEVALKAANDELEARVQQRTADLAATNRELAQKNEEVEAFVYIVSHDLRAPLVNLQGFSSELQRSCADLDRLTSAATLPAALARPVQQILKEDIPGALRFVTASAAKFERLIDALLTLSRYGRHEYRLVELDMQAVIGATLDALRQPIAIGGADVQVGALPPARGDATAVGQVFANLIGNAIKYLQPGRPGRVEIGGIVEGEMTRYWVRDNGAGIPEGATRRLFQVFQRFHPTLAGGEGMGLAIVKRVVERHGGRVWADTREGEGTTFHLTLPTFHPSQGDTA